MTSSFITEPSPIPPNTTFSVYYINTENYPDIQPPETIYQLIKQGDTGIIYSSFNANSKITTQSLSEPYFFTRDTLDNIYYTTYAFYTSGSIQVYLLNNNGGNTTIPTVAISNVVGSFNSLRGISIGSSNNELWVADLNLSGNGIFKQFLYTNGEWGLSDTFTPTNTGQVYLSDKIQGIKYRDGFIYVCNNDSPNGVIYKIDVTGSTEPLFSDYTNTNTDSPQDLTFDTSGNLYYINNYTGTFGSLVMFNGLISTILIPSSYIQTLNNTNSGIFSNLGGLTFNNDYTTLYITGTDSKSIMYYNLANPNVLTVFVTDNIPSGTGNSGLIIPYGIISDTKNNIYVADFNTDNNDGYIQKIQGLQYNYENIAGLDPGTYPVEIYNFSTSSIITNTSFSINVQCFLKGTKILCMIDGNEKYICIENIKPNDLVKTYKYGFIPVENIGYSIMQNSIEFNLNKLFKIKKIYNSELIEDLYVSGKHSKLVDVLTENQKEKTLTIWSKLSKIDDKYLLMACFDEKFIDVRDENKYEMYQIILKSNNPNKQFGIWSNGILTESMSKNTFIRKKQLVPLF